MRKLKESELAPAVGVPAPSPELVKPQERVPIPPQFHAVLLSLYHQRQSLASQIEVMQNQLKYAEQQVINAHGELTGMVKGVVLAQGLDQNAVWDLSTDCMFLVKR